MGTIVLLAVGAAWAAVLVPPLLRARIENRPNSSVSDFRRQLSTLQRTVPTRGMGPGRAMARPLVPSQARHSQVHRHVAPHPGVPHTQMLSRSSASATVGLERRAEYSDHAHHRQSHVRRVSQRELVRRRRANVLFMLVIANAVTLFLLATTKANFFVYGFALAFVALCGYCYQLVQIRDRELGRSNHERWY
jgi:hypothetical protein